MRQATAFAEDIRAVRHSCRSYSSLMAVVTYLNHGYGSNNPAGPFEADMISRDLVPGSRSECEAIVMFPVGVTVSNVDTFTKFL